MHDRLAPIVRYLIVQLCFFLPSSRRKRLERWLRGREEYHKLHNADAVIVSFGKSGRTWLRLMLSRFYSARYGLNQHLLVDCANMHKKNTAIPILFFSHDNYLGNYTGQRTSKADFYNKKVIFLIRHPLDVAVSQFFQWQYRMRASKKKLNDYPTDPHLSLYDFMLHPAGLPRVVDYLNTWSAAFSQIKDLHIIRYEAMRTDPHTELRRLLVFLDEDAASTWIDEAVRFASIDNMRAMEAKGCFWLSGRRLQAKDKNNPNSYKVRKAKVGGYRDYFDDQQVAYLEQWVAEHLNDAILHV